MEENHTLNEGGENHMAEIDNRLGRNLSEEEIGNWEKLPLLSAKHVQQLLGCSQNAVYELMLRAGRIKVGVYCITPKQLKEQLAKDAEKPPSMPNLREINRRNKERKNNLPSTMRVV